MKSSTNILICPLNWGLGHASRMIPIIDFCIKRNKNIIIAGNGNSLDLLARRFPNLEIEYIPAPTLQYSTKRAIGFTFYFNFFLLFVNMYRERKYLKNIVNKYMIDTIISDNRPGIYLPKLKSIYFTHQINVYPSKNRGILSNILSKLHKNIIKKYDYCFVPDFDNNSYAGRLSKNTTGLNLKYIGPLSRFSIVQPNYSENKPKYDIVCIISGPEPQRKVFEDILIKKFKNENTKTLIFRGLPEKQSENIQIGNIRLINHCDDSEFLSYLNSAEIILCRSGYSTIMDLITIRKNAILIPTPGQPEQEYLGNHLKKYGFICVKQNDILNFDITETSFIDYKPIEPNGEDLKNLLDLYL